jgi:glyoxylase-like metal-dependent hydrolase (beta-lactamase superfamily II)
MIPARLVPAEPLDDGTFSLEGNAIVALDIGHTDTDHTTCLHVPSLGFVVAGDAIYNGTHPYLVESDGQGLNDWLAAIDKIEALNPRAVVVGHGPLDPDNSPRRIHETRRYIRDFIRLKDETAPPENFMTVCSLSIPTASIPDHSGAARTPPRPRVRRRPDRKKSRVAIGGIYVVWTFDA